ncbi:hypothetical protein Ciccas_011627 [Cichlidogyrus casuarinus]|uniref:Uncharacterized protein n=1 Tax=Cichlidogyrus casuarinus TaxID=1844966 RepID=A0ABD2PQP1_9PLAT
MSENVINNNLTSIISYSFAEAKLEAKFNKELEKLITDFKKQTEIMESGFLKELEARDKEMELMKAQLVANQDELEDFKTKTSHAVDFFDVCHAGREQISKMPRDKLETAKSATRSVKENGRTNWCFPKYLRTLKKW